METIGKKIKILRKGRKLTQQEFADKIGIDRASVSNYETGRRVPHLNQLQKIADFFGVNLAYFGIAAKDEVFETLNRVKGIFEDQSVSKEEKEKLYKEIMKLYLEI